eukprot:COSAG01_NODE_3020_length_6711_cov_2.945251_3_plen_148_part_00
MVAGRGGRRSDAGTTVLGVMSGGGAEKRGSRRRNEIASKAAVLLGARAHRRSGDQLQHLGNHNNGGIRQRRLAAAAGMDRSCCWLLRLAAGCDASHDACLLAAADARSLTHAGCCCWPLAACGCSCLPAIHALFHSRSSKKIRLWMG